MEFIVGDDGNGLLLRSYLKKLKISSKQSAHLKRLEGGITVNGAPVTVRYQLKAGDVVGLAIEDAQSGESAEPVELPLSIIYEDDDLVVCNKPPFMPTHPSHGHHYDTLANALAFYYVKQERPFVFRPVNRLDRNTSGVVMVAKHARAASMMYTEMLNRRMEKEYLAVLEGELTGAGIVDKSLRRSAESIIVREVCDSDAEGAQSALTEYRTVYSGNGISLVELSPKTGRTHQLRVHMANLGHPILGDGLYGRDSDVIDRQALHAYRLTFRRPSDGETVTVEAPLPDDMAAVLESYGCVNEYFKKEKI
ncbi:MAG: RluA family pseudouridine synthase [Clostridia bacterium]|nr:RluA family pseudouridine synthase [Clostridia bacterium]